MIADLQIFGKANLKFTMLYTCSLCGKRKHGATRREEVTFDSPEELQRILNNLRPTPAAMPLNWGYCAEFYCEECKEEYHGQ